VVALQVDQDGAVPVPASPRPVVDTQHADRGAGGQAHRNSTRSSVSGLTGRPRRPASRAPASPPRARATGSSTAVAAAVRRAYRVSAEPKRSANVRRGQVGVGHRKRRTVTTHRAGHPRHGTSCGRRW
jgi:hypothetical protein